MTPKPPVHVSRTIDQRRNAQGYPKAGELIDMKPSRELSLQESRIFNLLIENAGHKAASDDWHEIAMQKLRGAKHKGSERVRDAVRNLMVTLVELPDKDRHGAPAVRTTALLSDNVATIDEDDPRALLRYKFTETMREIIKSSRHWGRLKGYVIFAFGSRYALTLYEQICLRINLQTSEQFLTVDQFREFMQVPAGKYQGAPQLKQRVIDYALLEVNGLSDFMVEIEPVREGGAFRGKLKGFTLRWRKKDPDEWAAALDELGRSRLGRRARLQETVETVIY